MEDHSQFYARLRQYIADNPDAAAHVSDYVAEGLQVSLDKAYERASDMEVALAAAISKRFKGANGLILSKLKKWQGHTSCRWDSTIKELEEREPENI